jgi:hypothetical protein
VHGSFEKGDQEAGSKTQMSMTSLTDEIITLSIDGILLENP